MSIFAALNIYHDIAPCSAAMNMAIDEAMLESAAAPSIRFYRWKSPALSFGYFGRFAEVADNASERDLVRRWTGGGIVSHGEDLTYSVVIPANDPVFAESSMSIYAAIHVALRTALIANGERAELSAVATSKAFGASTIRDRSIRRSEITGRELNATVTDRRYNDCFANPVQADVMIDGRKVAGAAQRRTRGGLLQQGSVQLATGRVRVAAATGYVDLENGLAERFVQALSAHCSERKIADNVLKRGQELARQKYGSDTWLRRR